MSKLTSKCFDEIIIGQKAHMQRTLTFEDVVLFGVMSGDVNPVHFPNSNSLGMGHGMWGVSLIFALIGNDLPGPGTFYKSQNINFVGQVSIGDILNIVIEVIAKDTSDHSVIFDCIATNQRGEKILTGQAIVTAPTEKKAYVQVTLPSFTLNHSNHIFEKLIEQCADIEPVSVAVCHPCDEVSLQGAVEAAEHGLIDPVLVGPKKRIHEVANEYSLDISEFRIVDTEHSHESAAISVALCRSGECSVLMKGSLHTDEMMHEVAERETGLRTSKRISHVFIFDVPSYPKMLLITDAAINIYPTLMDKVDILQNAVDLAIILGVEKPKVAILSAVETVYPKITSTVEAAALCKMADRGQITGAILDGPLAFDNAINAKAAKIKKIISPVAGQADILLVPDIEAGNMIAKQLTYLANAEMAGIVMGAKNPIILTSRADSSKARLASCAIAVLFAHHEDEMRKDHRKWKQALKNLWNF